MEQRNLNNELYATRDFGRKLSDTIEFVRSNWRLLLRYEIYLLLPISVIMAFFTNNLVSDYSNLISALTGNGFVGIGLAGYGHASSHGEILVWIANMLGSFLSYELAFVALSALVYGVMHFFFFTDKNMSDLSFQDLKPKLWYFAKRSFILSLVSLLLMVLATVVLIVVFVGITFLFGAMRFAILPMYLMAVLAIIALTIPLLLVMPIYMLEPECTVVDAYLKAFRLGLATWGGVFAVTFVIGLVVSILQMVTTVPWYVMVFTKQLFTLTHQGDAGVTGSFLFSFTQYLFCILECFGALVASTFSVVGITIQYGHAADKIDGRGVAQHIDQFDQFDNI